MGMVLLGRSGFQADAASEVLGVRLFHSEFDFRNVHETYKGMAEKATVAFVERQIAQHFKDDEAFDERALIAGLMRNGGGRRVPCERMRLAGSSLLKVMLLPEETRAAFFPGMMQEGQLNLRDGWNDPRHGAEPEQSEIPDAGRNALKDLPRILRIEGG
ncbi:MAG: hypothetical protein U0176_26770 [Bacteroidia bacterium]